MKKNSKIPIHPENWLLMIKQSLYTNKDLQFLKKKNKKLTQKKRQQYKHLKYLLKKNKIKSKNKKRKKKMKNYFIKITILKILLII